MRNLRRFFTFLTVSVLVLSGWTVPVTAESETPGVSVYKDESSPSGYTVQFVYDGSQSEKEISTVAVTGPFSYTYAYTSDDAGMESYSPYQYANGMYASNYHPDTQEWGYTQAMTDDDGDGIYTVSFPITSGSFGYHYVIAYTDETSETIADPANPPQKMNARGEKNSGDTHTSIVKGHWDEVKQSESPNMDYVLPTEGEAGTVQYVPYTAADGATSYIGVYLPAGYSTEHEPYKTIYISHGGGGDETDWFHMGSADDIMDNLVNEGKTEPAVIITMDNTHFHWDFDQILPNIVDVIIPFVERNYNVSADKDDRAMIGLSMGGITTTNMFWNYPDSFGYFGMLSGTNVPDEGVEMKAEYADPIVMVTAGTADFASRQVGGDSSFTSERLDEWCRENIPDTYRSADNIYVKGSHDWFTWPEALERFLTTVVWRDADGNLKNSTRAENGVTVNGSEAVFSFDDTDERNAVEVTVAGNFQWYKKDEVTNYDASGDNSAIPVYDAYHYEDGMFNAGYGLNGMINYPLVQTSGEHFELELTLPGNLYYYDYTVTYADGSTVTMKDPANLPEANPNNGHDAGHSLFYVGSSENCTPGQEAIYPDETDQKGTWSFVTYQAVDGTEQPLGIYLPYGYDVRKEYKTIYVSHGGGGNENEWMTIGAVPNIMDNLIAQGKTEPAVVVTMDNTYFDWDMDKVIPNITDCILPYVEQHYRVSSDPLDRAFCGLSMGSMTTNTMARLHPDLFRYFGSFSGGAGDLNAEDYNAEELKKDVLYLTAGAIDMAYNNNLGISTLDYLAVYDELGVPYSFELKYGAHDWGVWRDSYTTFVRDYLWKLDEGGNGSTSEPVSSTSMAMYRVYNPNSGEHHYTADSHERDVLVSLGWNDEGIGWYAPKTSDTPVYRLYNANGGEHHYAMDIHERNVLMDLGWKYEGIGWYSDDEKTVPVCRQYNPHAFANNHNYTANVKEKDYLISVGWNDEGIGWYAVKAGSAK